jgi:3-mercaptopyruvate sulfurtransferase SseA
VALILRGRGIARVRPLAGGFHAWRDLGYPTTSVSNPTEAPPTRP